MDTLLQDLRYGTRALLRSPAFTLVAVLALALGIGANSAIFSLIDGILLRPLPYPDPDRLVMVWEHNFGRDRARNVASPANFLQWQERSTSFEQLAGFAGVQMNLTGAGEPTEIDVQVVNWNIFPLLGVSPQLGRTFTAEEDRDGHDQVAVLSHTAWHRFFNGSRGVIGRRVSINSLPYTVVGVMSAGFKILDEEPDAWVPFGLPPAAREPRGRFLTVFGRLKRGVTVAQAQSEMDALAAALREQWPAFNTGWGVNLVPMQEQLVGNVRRALWVLLGAVGCVLLIACANVANLLLVRGSGRQRELAIRSALGAARGRLVRQLLTESALLGIGGGLAGLLFAALGLMLLKAAVADRVPLPRLDEIHVDGGVLAFTLAVAVLTSVLFGLVPALNAVRARVNESLKEGSRGSTSGRLSQRLRRSLIVLEVALAVVLLVGAGLLLRSFVSLQRVDPGFDPSGVLTMYVQLPQAKYPEPHQRTAFFAEALSRVESLPGVRQAGAISFLPFTGPGAATRFTLLDRPEPPPGEEPVADVRVVAGDFFRALGIPLIRGRFFDRGDAGDASNVVLINQTMARQFFGETDPLGKTVAISWDRPVEDTIVGVVGDIRHQTLDAPPRAMVYWPHTRVAYGGMSLVLRTDGEPTAVARAAVQRIHELDADQPVADIHPFDAVLGGTVAQPRLTVTLLGIFAALAMLLAALGLYGVMAYTVAQRTQEVGIRMALGARSADVLSLILGNGLLLVVIGLAAGLAASLALTRVLEGLLFETTPTDPLTFALVAGLLLATAAAAMLVPARRALRVDPTVALRYE